MIWGLGLGCEVWGVGFGFCDLNFRVSGFGSGFGFRVSGFGFGAWRLGVGGSGYRVGGWGMGFGLRVQNWGSVSGFRGDPRSSVGVSRGGNGCKE